MSIFIFKIHILLVSLTNTSTFKKKGCIKMIFYYICLFLKITDINFLDMMEEKTRYSDDDLQEFKGIIEVKLLEADEDLQILRDSLSYKDDNGTDDTGRSFNIMEDGSDTLSREEMAQLALRQEKFIENLKNALIRIENKTYGICRVTGKLIKKERLKLVPHATLSIEAKNMQDNG